MASKPIPEQDGKGRFISGNIGGGRPKGSRAKLGEQFLSDLQADWENNGVAALVAVRETRPEVYVKVVASILPQQINVTRESEMTDDELVTRIRQLAELAADAIGNVAGISVSSGGTEQASKPH